MGVHTGPRAFSKSCTGAAEKQLSLKTPRRFSLCTLSNFRTIKVLAEQQRVPPEHPLTSAQPSGGLANETRKLRGHEVTLRLELATALRCLTRFDDP